MQPDASILKQLDFGNEAGDDLSPDELINYFVEQDTFHQFLDEKKRLAVVTARKGVGKSALLKWIEYKIKHIHPEALVIRVRGADLTRSKFYTKPGLQSPNDSINDWMVRICTLINRRLATEIKVALTDDQITLVETAEIEGYKERNLLGALTERLLPFISEKRSPQKLKAMNETELLKRNSKRQVWIIVDDLDATYQNTSEESLELATFFSACRYLIQDVKGLNIRASVRTDVWALIKRYDESLDKMSQYVSEITWTQRDFLALLALRIRASTGTMQSSSQHSPRFMSSDKLQEQVLELAFVPKMQWGSNRDTSEMQPSLQPMREIETYKVIYTLSYERPRWAIQLCKLAREAALRQNQSRISKISLDQVWGEYGGKRIADVVAEHKHQCPQVNELLNAFRGAERLMTIEALLTRIKNHVSEHLELSIEGRATRAPREIASFLYRIGFIVARSDDEEGEYEHYRFEQMPDFLLGRTDHDFAVKWEIHPCYRQALDIKQLNQSHKERFRRNRR